MKRKHMVAAGLSLMLLAGMCAPILAMAAPVLSGAADEKAPPPAAPPATPAASPPETPATAPPAPVARPAAEKDSIQKYLKDNQLRSRLDGKAKLILKPDGAPQGNIYSYSILVDMSGVAVVIEDKERIPAVLGAYTLAVKFDSLKVQARDVLGGTTAEFAGKPVSTNLVKANNEGLIRFSAVHTSSQSPRGLISVAKIVLTVFDPKGLDSISVWGDSLATSILFFPDKKIAGPFLIPFEGNQLPRRPLTASGRPPAAPPMAPPAAPPPAEKKETPAKDKTESPGNEKK